MKKKNETQHSLFDEESPNFLEMEDIFPAHGAARHSDPQTSKVAAAMVKAGELELIFLTCLFHHGNRTAEEITTITGRPIDSITPRSAPLDSQRIDQCDKGT